MFYVNVYYCPVYIFILSRIQIEKAAQLPPLSTSRSQGTQDIYCLWRYCPVLLSYHRSNTISYIPCVFMRLIIRNMSVGLVPESLISKDDVRLYVFLLEVEGLTWQCQVYAIVDIFLCMLLIVFVILLAILSLFS